MASNDGKIIYWRSRPQLTVGRALGSHLAKYTTRITLFYQGKIAIIGVHKEIQMSKEIQISTRITFFYQGKIAIIGVHKEIQMSIYPGKGGLTCFLSNVVKKVCVHGCISW